MDITPRKRGKIVTLHEHTSMSHRKIAKTVGVSKGSVYNILKQKQESGNVDIKRKGNCGRKRKTTKRDDISILRNSKLHPRKTSEDLKRDLDATVVHVSSSTVRRRLLKEGKRARKPKKKQLLTATMKKKRCDWAKKYQNWSEEDWNRVLFSDESHFFVQGFNPKFVRCSPKVKLREEYFVQSVKHPDKKMFWGCFSVNSPGALVPVEGMMNSKTYLPIIESRVSRELASLHPQAVFQQDSAPCHKAKIITNCFKKLKMEVLEWPGNSPDLNPIENLWSIVKNCLRKKDCTTKTKLIESVINVWFHDDEIKNISKKLVMSMKKRVDLVLQAKGGHINY